MPRYYRALYIHRKLSPSSLEVSVEFIPTKAPIFLADSGEEALDLAHLYTACPMLRLSLAVEPCEGPAA